MNQDFVIQVLQESLAVVFEVAGPILLVALVTGTAIAILQAATQVNEMTLTFVPKLAAVGALLWLMGSYIMGTLTTFADRMFTLIAVVGGAQ